MSRFLFLDNVERILRIVWNLLVFVVVVTDDQGHQDQMYRRAEGDLGGIFKASHVIDNLFNANCTTNSKTIIK